MDWFVRVYPPRTLAISVVITIIVWFAGTLGTFMAMHPVFRFVYWGVPILGSVPFAHEVRMTVTRRWSHLPTWVIALVAASVFSVAYTPVVYLATKLGTAFDLASMIPIWTMWIGTFIASACAYIVRVLLAEQDGIVLVETVGASPEHPRLLQRIETGLRGPLVSISVRDHYVDVRTTAGQSSLLMRLSDAITETEGVEGARVHRSHWVAWDAVQGVDRRGGNVVLRMVDGAVIPVSRNHREKLEERGLI